MSSYIVRGGLLLFILGFLALFNWPDIRPFLDYLQQAFNMLKLLDPLLDMDALFNVGKAILTIEIILLTRRVVVALVQFLGGGSFNSGGDSDDE